jgi:hypothetical protein
MRSGNRSKVAARLLVGGLLVIAVIACGGAGAEPDAGQAARQLAQGGELAQGGPAATAAPAAAPEDPANVGGPEGNGAPSSPGQYIVRTGTLELEVGDIDAALLHARELVQGVGGYVAAENDSTVEGRRAVVMTYRIPVDRWQEEVDALRGLANTVIAENTEAEEVTSQVVDLNARIDNLRTSEASLRDIMDRAQTVDDVLAVQQRLETVQGEIEQLVAQQQDITGRAALGTLQVHWEEPYVAPSATPRPTPFQEGFDVGREIDRSVGQATRVGQAAASFGVWLIFFGIPVLGPIVLLLLIGAWLVRRWQRTHPRPEPVGWGTSASQHPSATPTTWGAAEPTPGVDASTVEDDSPPGADSSEQS